MKAVARALLFALAAGIAGTTSAHAATLPPTNPVLVVPVRASDSPTLSLAYAHKASLFRAGAFWKSASRSRVTMYFTYAPTTTVAAYTERALCAGAVFDRLAKIALSRPIARGKTFSVVVIVVRGRTVCFPTSTYTVSSGGTRIILLSADLLAREHSTAAHELGHSLGLGHSHSAVMTAPGEQPAYLSEYGDSWSVMGNSGSLAAPPAPMQAALGWLEATPAARGGTFTLAPLSAGSALVLDRGAGSRLWIEWRDDGPGAGVMLHVETGSNPGYAQSWLVTPVPLPVGATWTDPYTGATVTVGAGKVVIS